MYSSFLAIILLPGALGIFLANYTIGFALLLGPIERLTKDDVLFGVAYGYSDVERYPAYSYAITPAILRAYRLVASHPRKEVASIAIMRLSPNPTSKQDGRKAAILLLDKVDHGSMRWVALRAAPIFLAGQQDPFLAFLKKEVKASTDETGRIIAASSLRSCGISWDENQSLVLDMLLDCHVSIALDAFYIIAGSSSHTAIDALTKGADSSTIPHIRSICAEELQRRSGARQQ